MQFISAETYKTKMKSKFSRTVLSLTKHNNSRVAPGGTLDWQDVCLVIPHRLPPSGEKVCPALYFKTAYNYIHNLIHFIFTSNPSPKINYIFGSDLFLCSGLASCRLIDVRYFIELHFQSHKNGPDIMFPVEIVLGTIPLRNCYPVLKKATTAYEKLSTSQSYEDLTFCRTKLCGTSHIDKECDYDKFGGGGEKEENMASRGRSQSLPDVANGIKSKVAFFTDSNDVVDKPPSCVKQVKGSQGAFRVPVNEGSCKPARGAPSDGSCIGSEGAFRDSPVLEKKCKLKGENVQVRVGKKECKDETHERRREGFCERESWTKDGFDSLKTNVGLPLGKSLSFQRRNSRNSKDSNDYVLLDNVEALDKDHFAVFGKGERKDIDKAFETS